jgi:hypothetical protein
MTAAELLDMLRDQGFRLTAEGDRVRVTPASRLTAEQRRAIQQHRAELLTALRVVGKLDAATTALWPPGFEIITQAEATRIYPVGSSVPVVPPGFQLWSSHGGGADEARV